MCPTGLVIIAWLAYSTLKPELRDLILSSRIGISEVASFAPMLLFKLLFKVGGAFLVFGAADFAIQKKLYMNELMMSKEEIKQEYKEGSLVRRGQVLFEIDPRPFQAALARAKGDLAQAQAQLGKSTLDVKRDTPLAEARAIAQSQLDNEIQAKLGAQAAVESDQAAIEQAELNLEWTKITSF